MPSVILDTNVLIAALRSCRGASFKVLNLLGSGIFQICVSVPLVLEYKSVTKRMSRSLGLIYSDIDDILDYICLVAEHRKIFYLWRPCLKDPMDNSEQIPDGRKSYRQRNFKTWLWALNFNWDAQTAYNGIHAAPPSDACSSGHWLVNQDTAFFWINFLIEWKSFFFVTTSYIRGRSLQTKLMLYGIQMMALSTNVLNWVVELLQYIKCITTHSRIIKDYDPTHPSRDLSCTCASM